MGQELHNNLFLTLKNITKLLIVIKGSPDPDVLASSFALKVVCELRKIEVTIVSLMEVSLPQNRAIIQKLEIPVHFVKKIHDPEYYDGYAVLDHQSASIEDIGTKIPCLIHIDHHEAEDDFITPVFKYIDQEVGAVSTLFADILKSDLSSIAPPIITKIATALYYGIKIDTDDFRHAGDTDIEAASWLHGFADEHILADMDSIPYSEETITVISKAIMNSFYYKDWLFCGVGFIPEKYRDSIAITADYMLVNEDLFAVVVFAIIERKSGDGLFMDASIRTSEGSFDLNKFIKLVSPEGGARSFKGAFQVNLDFFASVSDRTKLWELVRDTALTRLMHARDHFPAVVFETLFSKVSHRIKRIFKK